MMRRESRSFTVEVRKGQKRAQQTPAGEQPQTGSSHGGTNSLEDIFRRAEAALFERAPQPQPDHSADRERTRDGDKTNVEHADSAQPSASLPGRGRILETLDQADPLESLMAERTQATRRGRKPGSKNKPKLPTQTSMSPLSDLPILPQRKAIGPAARQAPPAKVVFTRSEDIQHAGHATLNTGPAVASGDDGRTRARGSIRGRYVTGSELRPGERWKRRLRHG